MTPIPPTPKDLFLEALEQPQAEREAFVRRACGEDRDLQQRVSALLMAHGRSDSLLQACLPPELSVRLHEGVRNVARRLGLEAG